MIFHLTEDGGGGQAVSQCLGKLLSTFIFCTEWLLTPLLWDRSTIAQKPHLAKHPAYSSNMAYLSLQIRLCMVLSSGVRASKTRLLQPLTTPNLLLNMGGVRGVPKLIGAKVCLMIWLISGLGKPPESPPPPSKDSKLTRKLKKVMQSLPESLRKWSKAYLKA